MVGGEGSFCSIASECLSYVWRMYFLGIAVAFCIWISPNSKIKRSDPSLYFLLNSDGV